ncbi:MAG: GNAT family N-acetyltransferase [Clostridia bacterium]|nr:GNAT family N-acetyltransferase [Clostridia bacterium]
MKIHITAQHTFEDIEKYLFPIKQFCEEKARKGIYDDWDEAKHTAEWIKKVMSSIQMHEKGQLDIYYLEENETIIGVAFALIGSQITLDSLAKDGIVPDSKEIAHFTGFHIIEACRGKGYGSAWLQGEIFEDLRAQGVKQIYIKSSHHQALALYERLGTKVGNYIGISDSKLYQRYGYIYKIDL